MKKVLCYVWATFLFFALHIPSIANAEALPEEVSGSIYGTITSIISMENQVVLSIHDGSLLYTFLAQPATPCLYQGKHGAINQLQTGSQAWVSYTGEYIDSILVLSFPSNEAIASSVYGMYYDFYEGQLRLTLPGGEMKTYRLASSVTYWVNDFQVTYTDFYKLSLPGDDIKIYLNSKNEVLKIEGYVVKDNEVAKTNPTLLQ